MSDHEHAREAHGRTPGQEDALTDRIQELIREAEEAIRERLTAPPSPEEIERARLGSARPTEPERPPSPPRRQRHGDV